MPVSIYMCFSYLSIYLLLSIYLCIYLSTHLSIVIICVGMYVCANLSSCPSVYIFLPICLFSYSYLSMYLFVFYLSIYLSIYPSNHLSICVSIKSPYWVASVLSQVMLEEAYSGLCPCRSGLVCSRGECREPGPATDATPSIEYNSFNSEYD